MKITFEPKLTVVGCGEWHGMEARLVETTTGHFEGLVRADHALLFHLGAPARVFYRYDGDARARLQHRGMFDLIPGGSMRSWDDEDPTSTMSLWFSPALVEAVADGMKGAPGRCLTAPRTSEIDDALFAAALLLKGEVEAGEEQDPLFAESIGVAMIVRLLERFGVQATGGQAKLSRIQLNAVLDYLQSHLDETIRLATLADLAGLSPSHFRTLFRNTLGRPAHLYLTQLRLQRACSLLQRGQLSIAQVALETGFCHQSHLAKAMRRHLRLTPSDVARDRRPAAGWTPRIGRRAGLARA